ncbi:MAG: endonuclease Q family protein [Candidatus Omnitrophica bacterium]|nr:endonuclease Q family protein [Candidatus Omnitrophota bacterium]MCM8816042.1 endonuclease Q family protein [Candidatus Omnitrophota bacterium]
MYVADFHIHSKYSRATSKNMDIEHCAQWAKIKGISLLGTGDITHPLWFSELKEKLKPSERSGIYVYNDIEFILTGEVNNIFPKDNSMRKIHNIVFFSSFETAEKFNKTLEKFAELMIDGRPILQIDARTLIKLVRDADPEGFVVPAHIWTPHFSLFGANSGFDRIEDCFEEETENILALETGLSSDPPMNWLLSQLDRFTLVSNSDSHSPQKIGREANVFNQPFNFFELKEILKTKDNKRFLFTIEYFPEEGKYHYDGHRLCKVRLSPTETIKHKYLCPVCGKKVTVGVMHRVITLSDRKNSDQFHNKIPFKRLVPLDQIIASVYQKEVESSFTQQLYSQAISKLGPELKILLEIPEKELFSTLPEEIAAGIKAVREEKIVVIPGYDGEFGTVKINVSSSGSQIQQTLF